MKRKYYLRGLGFGILITALVFIIAAPGNMSDDEIIKRAEELGYVKADGEDASSLGIKDLLEKSTPAPTKAAHTVNTPVPEKTPVPTNAPTLSPTIVPTKTPVPTPTVMATNTPTPTATPTPTPTETPVPTPTVISVKEIITATIVVERGNSASIVCNKLVEAKILEDGGAFRRYLVQNNLTDYINIGTYTLSSDMSFEEIAKQLTGR